REHSLFERGRRNAHLTVEVPNRRSFEHLARFLRFALNGQPHVLSEHLLDALLREVILDQTGGSPDLQTNKPLLRLQDADARRRCCGSFLHDDASFSFRSASRTTTLTGTPRSCAIRISSRFSLCVSSTRRRTVLFAMT